MDALHHALPLAIPALHGHRMDVSRGLRAGGLSGSSSWEATNSVHGLAEHASGPLFDSCPACPRAPRACRSFLHGGSFATGLLRLLLQRPFASYQIYPLSTSPSFYTHFLLSITLPSS